mmetsp:Transcript_8945/g.21984  ORF Transcript_8945/g.21984 Transcript_8945/m.21984 type:complete len:246 (+) Transcript_8945:1007-1744(+)
MPPCSTHSCARAAAPLRSRRSPLRLFAKPLVCMMRWRGRSWSATRTRTRRSSVPASRWEIRSVRWRCTTAWRPRESHGWSALSRCLLWQYTRARRGGQQRTCRRRCRSGATCDGSTRRRRRTPCYTRRSWTWRGAQASEMWRSASWPRWSAMEWPPLPRCSPRWQASRLRRETWTGWKRFWTIFAHEVRCRRWRRSTASLGQRHGQAITPRRATRRRSCARRDTRWTRCRTRVWCAPQSAEGTRT